MNVYLVEDNLIYRSAFAAILRDVLVGEQVWCSERVGGLPQLIAEHGSPDLIFLDMTLPDTMGASGILEIKRLYPHARVIALDESRSSELEHQCLQAGAEALLSKLFGAPAIQAALRALLSPGGPDEEPEKALTFTRRQSQLLAAIEKGRSNRDIADELGISEHTVKVHLWRLFQKMGVKSRTQAVYHLRSRGLDMHTT